MASTKPDRQAPPQPQGRPVVPADLTWVKVNGGRGYAQLVNWDDDTAPTAGLSVLAADGGSERLEAVITEVRASGTLVLDFPEFIRAE